MATSFQTVSNGSFMPRIVQPMSPVTTVLSRLSPIFFKARLMAMKLPRWGQPAQKVMGCLTLRAAAGGAASTGPTAVWSAVPI
jgi:hypothetical protein